MNTIILFIFGIAIGSFLNVLAVRYDPDRFLLAKPVTGGRSRCPKCKTTLRWFDLVPLVSFLALRGKCRTCKDAISVQYPLVELLSGLIFVLVPLFLSRVVMFSSNFELRTSIVLWVVFFSLLLLMSLIDFRLKLIPDEITIALILVGIGIALVFAPQFGLTSGSFIGHYAALFGFRDSFLINRVVAALGGALFFFLIFFVTRGRGMGFGDVKLMIPLGLAFGWPDIIILAAFAFIIGSIVGIVTILRGKGTRKSAIPFGPFLALGSVLLFFCGAEIVRWYFSLFIV